ncbi:response regulator [Microbacterium sp. NPDC078428]|uniref:response regulator transcription factor n=1 Tax=Microbacterium sp. NPDC078428 TaxID=3364190 RepID=UPI0037C7AD28
MHPLRVAVVEDQPLYRQMLGLLLSSTTGIRLVAACAGAQDAARSLRASEVDVALLDLHLPDGDGLGVGRALRRENPGIGIVILSASDSMHALLELDADEAAGWSYLSKSSALTAHALVRAIQHTAAGRTVLDPAVTRGRAPRPHGPLDALSARQFEVLGLAAEGLTNHAIAERLGLSRRSVDAHVNAIYHALGIQSSTAHNPRVTAVRSYLAHTARRAHA